MPQTSDNIKHARVCTRQSGFTLLEVMVAFLVLSIGLLGLAGLQVQGLRHNQNAYLRNQAVALAYDLAERMRGNPGAALAGAYAAGIANPGFDCMITLPGSPCTPAQMAAADLFLWSQNVNTLLPGGVAAVAGPNPSGYFTITVSWNETDETGTATVSNVSLNVLP
jgi:type IV pilus assembly protein PilV